MKKSKKIFVVATFLLISFILILRACRAKDESSKYMEAIMSQEDIDTLTEIDSNESRQRKNDISETSLVSSTTSKVEVSTATSSEGLDTRPVYIVGAVNKAGVYQIGRMKYLYELVDLAGGLTDEADEESVNLAMEIKALSRYKIYKKGENTKLDSEEIFNDNNEKSEESISEEDSINNSKVNINTASINELCNIPGIGEKTASAIISYRESKGGKITIEDLKSIKGIKGKKYQKIKKYLTE